MTLLVLVLLMERLAPTSTWALCAEEAVASPWRLLAYRSGVTLALAPLYCMATGPCLKPAALHTMVQATQVITGSDLSVNLQRFATQL